MAKVAGRARLPLPASCEHDLKRIGFVYREVLSTGQPYHLWQHKRFPSIEVQVTRMNLPGSEQLIWKVTGGHPENTSEEAMIRRLETLVQFRTNPNVFIADVAREIQS